jgi:hypothetical protein
VNQQSSTIQVFTRTLDFAPTGLAFGPSGSAFPGGLLVSDFLGVGLRRMTPTGVVSMSANLPSLQGLTFGAGATSPFGADALRRSPAVDGFASGEWGHDTLCWSDEPNRSGFGIKGRLGTDLALLMAGSGRIVRIDSTGQPTTLPPV